MQRDEGLSASGLSDRRCAHNLSERRPCGDGLSEVLVVLASAPEPKLRYVVCDTMRAAHCLHRVDELRCTVARPERPSKMGDARHGEVVWGK
jgi:hypothetical protein